MKILSRLTTFSFLLFLITLSCSNADQDVMAEEKEDEKIVNKTPTTKKEDPKEVVEEEPKEEPAPTPAPEIQTIDLSNWTLDWSDEFDYATRDDLLKSWKAQDGPSGHILSGRYKENIVVGDGTVELQNKKENRGGQEWTSGSMQTFKRFKYGYFECRYKYAASNGTNNSFWLFSRGITTAPGAKECEIDINEGHFPNEVNTNIHNFDDKVTLPDGRQVSTSDSRTFTFGLRPDRNIPLEIPVTTRKVRLVSNNSAKFHIREFRVYNDNGRNFPDVMSETADTDVSGLINYAKDKDVKISVSGTFTKEGTPNSVFAKENVADGKVLGTSWVSQDNGEKFLEFEWNKDITIGAIQFINGWNNNGDWVGLIEEYKVQYYKDGKWINISTLDVKEDINFAKNYNVYGLEWDENNIIFYFNGEEIRREPNNHCYTEMPIYLSLAIIKWDGPVTDAIDGTSMKVDYVRYYKKKQ